jgi:hypothetical protein
MIPGPVRHRNQRSRTIGSIHQNSVPWRSGRLLGQETITAFPQTIHSLNMNTSIIRAVAATGGIPSHYFGLPKGSRPGLARYGQAQQGSQGRGPPSVQNPPLSGSLTLSQGFFDAVEQGFGKIATR